MFVRFLVINMKFLAVVCALLCLAQARVQQGFSEPACRKTEPSYKRCLWKNTERIIPFLIKAIPDMIDPVEIPYLKLNRTINEFVSVIAEAKNIKVWGTSNFIIEHLEANPKALTLEVRFLIPRTHVEVDYDVKGQMLQVPMDSKGFYSGNYTDTRTTWKISLKVTEKEGVKHFKLDKFILKFHSGDGRFKLKADDPNRQYEADLITNFHNENSKEVIAALSPIFEEASNDMMRGVINKYLERFSIDNADPK